MNCFEERIRNIIRRNIDDKCLEFTNEDDLRDLGMNSVNCIAIIVEIEDNFGVEFENEELDIRNFSSVSKIMKMLTEHLHRK